MRNISAWSIRNPIVPLVIFAGLLLVGILSFLRLDISERPDIEFPVVIVTVVQPGAAPVEIENQITQRVEAAVRSINGVENINSTASEGANRTIIEFRIGSDIDQSMNEVESAISRIRGDLPDGILEPQVTKIISMADAMAYFRIEANDMTIEQLSWFVDDTLTQRLLALDGMAEVTRQGGVNREILVTLDPQKMQALGITAAQVNQALRQLNVNAAGGKAEIGGGRQSLRVLGNAQDAFTLSQTDIPLSAGRTVKLADIAQVTDAFGELTSISKSRGKPGITFGILRARGESDVRVYDEVVKELEKIEAEYPGIRFTQMYTSVKYTRDEYQVSMAAMVEGAILAVIVVFLFLRDWRATVIAALAIPLSAIPTFWFMDLMGFSLNNMSLLALGLVAGVLVDDAIVEIENIVRHMRMGKTAYQAAIDAADEIGLAVVATTFSIVAVFLPVALIPGVAGQFFKNFGGTIVVAVLISLAVARMITPMVAAYFLKAHGEAEHAQGPWMDRYLAILHWSLDNRRALAIKAGLPVVRSQPGYYLLETFLAAVALAIGCALAFGIWKGLSGFGAGLLASLSLALLVCAAGTWLVLKIAGRISDVFGDGFSAWHTCFAARVRARVIGDHRVWMLAMGLFALVLTALLAYARPSEFMPPVNADSAIISIEMPPGTTLRETENVSGQVAAIVEKEPDVKSLIERISEGSSRVVVMLKEDRTRTAKEFEAALAPGFHEIPDARISFMSSNSMGSGTGRDISIMLSGSNSGLLDETAARLVEEMKGLDTIVMPRISGDMRRPEVLIKPRLDLAASMGVSTAALSQAIRIATIGDIDQNAAKFSLSDRQVPIRVRLPESARRDLATIENLPVPTVNGGSVPLSRLAEITYGSGPTSIQRHNQQRRVFVGADLAPGVVKSVAMEKIAALPIMQNLPPGVSNAPFGTDAWMKEMVDSLTVAVPAGILLVFAVLVLLYHRVISPLVNMSSLFLAPLGGLIALTAANQPISVSVFIGILMLLGIVAKNSILLIDFAIEAMAAGATKFEAVIEAGHKRAQPIVMTTVAMTAGMLPTALSIGGDAAWRAPMGTVVIGGLILSTVLTLLIVPAAFSLADGVEKRIGPKLRRSFLTFEPEHREAEEASRDGRGQALPAE